MSTQQSEPINFVTTEEIIPVSCQLVTYKCVVVFYTHIEKLASECGRFDFTSDGSFTSCLLVAYNLFRRHYPDVNPKDICSFHIMVVER